MPEPLIGKSELPPVSILQMILEGPKGYFGRRGQMSDEQWLRQQQQQQQGQFAQGLVKTPEWQTAMTHPYDRMSQGGLWALTQGGPGNMAAQGGNWLQTAISGAYGREQQTYGGQLQLQQQAAAAALQQKQTQLENTLQLGRMAVANTYQKGMTTFEDALQKSRISMTTDEALRLEQGKLDIANKNTQQLMDQVFGVNPQTGNTNQVDQFLKDQKYNILAKNTGMQPLPDGMSIGTNPVTGGPAFVPTPGGKQWQEMVQKLSPLQQMNGAIDELMELDATGSNDKGRRQQLTAIVQDAIRQGSSMGTLDAGALQQMEKYINDYGSYTGYGANLVGSKNYATAQEKLRGLKVTTQQKIQDWSRTYIMDPARVGDPYAYTPAAQKVPKPSETADKAMKKLQPPPSVVQPAPSSKVNRGALPAGAPSIFDTGTGKDTGMRARGRGGR